MNDANYKFYLKAKDFLKENKYNEAIAIFRDIHKLEPNDSLNKFQLARLLIRNSKTLQEGKNMLEQMKDDVFAALELGRLELKEGHTNKARYYFEYLLNTKNDEYAILELGRLELQEGNKDKARYYFEYLLNTKNDEHAMLELGRLKLQEGNKDKARHYFEYLLNTKNDVYAKEELLFLNINEGKYEDAYKLLDSISDIMEKNVYSNTKNFLEYKLGISDRNSNNQINYFNSQLYNYDENLALDHISKHLDENDKKKVHSVFYSDVDLRELLLMVKDKIGNAVPNRSTIIDKYIVNCDDSIATIESKETKYIEVITFSNTKNIITMYPVLISENELDKPKKLIKK